MQKYFNKKFPSNATNTETSLSVTLSRYVEITSRVQSIFWIRYASLRLSFFCTSFQEINGPWKSREWNTCDAVLRNIVMMFTTITTCSPKLVLVLTLQSHSSIDYLNLQILQYVLHCLLIARCIITEAVSMQEVLLVRILKPYLFLESSNILWPNRMCEDIRRCAIASTWRFHIGRPRNIAPLPSGLRRGSFQEYQPVLYGGSSVASDWSYGSSSRIRDSTVQYSTDERMYILF